jgi:hypothetical protein
MNIQLLGITSSSPAVLISRHRWYSWRLSAGVGLSRQVSILILTFGDTILQRFGSHQWFQHFARRRLWQACCDHNTGPEISMFKISTFDTPSQRKLLVEGRLTEPWVGELRTTWRNANHDLDGRKLVIDLSSLTVISREGEDAIFDLMKQGAKFSCAGILTKHVLKGLARKCRCEP